MLGGDYMVAKTCQVKNGQADTVPAELIVNITADGQNVYSPVYMGPAIRE